MASYRVRTAIGQLVNAYPDQNKRAVIEQHTTVLLDQMVSLAIRGNIYGK